MTCLLLSLAFLPLANARDIVFPQASGYTTDQVILGDYSEPDISQARFAGLNTYANLPYVHCLAAEGEEVEKFDIAILGAPFDTIGDRMYAQTYGIEVCCDYAVYNPPDERCCMNPTHCTYVRATLYKEYAQRCKSYTTWTAIFAGVTARPGARFGPSGVRQGSRRIAPESAWSIYTGENVLRDWARIVDCGDAPLTFLDNTAALKQLEKAHRVVSGKRTNSSDYTVPRILTLGGDHTTTLSALRSTYSHWGAVSVIHFDSHIDTWDPNVLGGGISHYAGVNHGTFLHIAHEEGLVSNTSIHAGIRAPVMRPHGDVRNDLRCGFEIIRSRDIDRHGVRGIVEKLKKRVFGTKVYISVDIDVLDPAFAPATGTAEVGGWSTRELLSILDGLEGLKVVGADVVEVSPVYDNPGETTILAAAEVALSLIGLMVKKPVA